MKSVIEFKGSNFTLMVLHLFDSNTEKIAEQLADKVSKSPIFFQNAPIVIDLQAVQDENNTIDLAKIVKLLRHHSFIPIAVRGGNPEQHEIALSMNLGILMNTKAIHLQPTDEDKVFSKKTLSSSPEEKPEIKPITAPIPLNAKIIQEPVRSGQQILALNGDLIVLATVSQGAEILARRHIHVYGALHGRALAGIKGDNEARIFCQHLDPEIISIAGQYRVNEDLPDNLRGKAAQIYLEEDNKLKIVPIEL
jgi:septum site-determining protein MinC